jgi:hypothetical protein
VIPSGGLIPSVGVGRGTDWKAFSTRALVTWAGVGDAE